MNARAKIIFLHGASSSGKSTIARALQAMLGEPFWHISIDHLRDAGVLPSSRIKAGDFTWSEMRGKFFDGFHRSLRAYADAGNNLIVEHILDTPGWHQQLAELLAPFDMLFVGIHCRAEELARRERARGDREVGSAERDAATIHKGVDYDVEVQSEDGLDHNLNVLLEQWRRRTSPSAFFKGRT